MQTWETPIHLKKKKEIFHKIDSFLKTPPKTILDIGCGLARESEYFQKKYGCDLYLLDGDFENTSNVQRQIKYGTVDNFGFYNKVNDLKKSFDSRKMKYSFIDANNIDIDIDLKFDLIMSNLSCGFHYPANTYKDLVKKHSKESTTVIFDLRNAQDHPDVEILQMVDNCKKHIKASIRFV